MKRIFVLLVISFAASGITPLRGDDLRVEWISGKSVVALRFAPGTDILRLCSLTRKKQCLVLQPGDASTCALSGGFLRCVAAGTTQKFLDLTAASPSPFHLEATITKSTGSEEKRSVQVGAVEVHIASNRLRVVIPVDLETYVTGVLTGEAGILKSPPALQAMAVVARTWALRSRGRHRREGFDFCSLTHCQVFTLPSESGSGASAEILRADQETKGKVLKYHGELIDPYFSADCGGMTEAAGDVWPDRSAPYLTNVRDLYCDGSEHSSWQQTLSVKTVSSILRDSMGVSLSSPLLDLKVERRDASGRARTLRLAGGSTRRVDANEFRYAVDRRLGWNTLKSNLYTLERHGDSLVFTGRGLGHGVGLCQAGAEQMGQRGIASEKILATYFPGTMVSNITPAASQDPILSSEHFELVFPDSQGPWAAETLNTLEIAHRKTESRGIALPAKIRVETFETTVEFIDASKQPGWAAASTDGVSISLQPLRTLKRKGILTSTLRHEVTHLGVHRLRSPEIPRWFEEGLVLYLTGEKVSGDSRFNFRGRSLEESISKPRSEAEMKAAYGQALDRIRNFARQHSEAALWQILSNPSEEDIRWLRNPK